MKMWHTVILVFVIYAVGAMYPAPFNFLKGKVGL